MWKIFPFTEIISSKQSTQLRHINSENDLYTKGEENFLAICLSFSLFMAHYLSSLKQLYICLQELSSRKCEQGTLIIGVSLRFLSVVILPAQKFFQMNRITYGQNMIFSASSHDLVVSLPSPCATSRSKTHLPVVSTKYSGISMLLAKKGMHGISHIIELLLVATNSNEVNRKKNHFFSLYTLSYRQAI